MCTETKNPRTGKSRTTRLTRWLRRAALVSVFLVAGGALTAGAVWTYRAPILEWVIKNRIEATGATAVLSVAVFDIDRLTIRNIRIDAPVDAAIKSLELKYDLDAFLSGRITSIEATVVRLKHKHFRVGIDRIAGDGEFAMGIRGVRGFQANLDILRATLAGEPIHPSRLTVAYRNDSLTLETTIPSARGFVALLAQGSLARDAPPYRITLSGRLDPALFPFLTDDPTSREAVSFAVNAKVADLLAGIASIRRGEWTLPEHFSADGDLELDLGRVSIAGYSIGASGRDRVRFRFDEMRTENAVMRGGVTIDIDVGPRRHRGVEFARANITINSNINLSGERLEITLKPGSESRIYDLRSSGGFRLDGESAFRLVEGNNRVVLDLKQRTARHRLQGLFTRRNGRLRLQSEGDLSAPDDPVVFTLQGKIDPAPLLALLPDVRVESGTGEIFVAGEAAALLPRRSAPGHPPPAATGSVRLDGAVTLQVKGAALPGLKKTDAKTDRITLNLRGFEAARDWQRGRFSLSAELAPRRLVATAVTSAAITLEGQMRSTKRGYRFRLEPGGAAKFGEIRSPLLTVRNGLHLQLTGKKNTVETDERFRLAAAQLRFDRIDVRGTVAGRSGQQTPFRLAFPYLTNSYGKDGSEYHGKNGTLTLPGLAVAAQGVSLTARMDTNGLSAELAARDVRHRVRRPLVSPVSMSARAVLREGSLKVKVQARQLRSPLAANATIDHDFNRNSGRMRFTAPRFNLETRRHRFGDMFPVALGWFDTIGGNAAADGELNWDRDLLSGRATVIADRVALAIQDLRISGMNGAINFIELSPLLMPPRQRFTGKFAFADLEPLPFQLEFQLNEDGSIAVQDLDIDVAKGRVRTRGIVAIHGSGLSATGRVEATSIALSDALRMLGIQGLEGDGRVSGSFPIALRNNVARIAGGRLAADSPGQLHYREGSLEDQLIGSPKSKGAIIRALSDFRFKSLDVELDKAFAGTGMVILRLSGNNPSVYDGNDFTIEMRVASDLRRLERLVLGGFHTSSDISRQADGPAPKR